MRVVALVVFIVALAAVARGQTTICEKYSALLGVSQAELMNETITSVAIAVAACGDCPTAGWFNGTYGNAGGANFLTNPAALNALIGKLMGFFGAALGCNSAAFTSIYGGGFQTDMTAVHANFQKRITKEAFEYFNQQVIDVLAGAGVENTDLFAVAKVLDGFRARATGATATNLVCQDPDCASSPFSVKVQPGYFNPAYLTATSGTVITFFKTDLSPHIITEANSSAACSEARRPALEIDLTGASLPQRTEPLTRDVTYFDVVNCNVTEPVTGQIRVVAGAISLSVSLFALLCVALAAML